jgi:hypothetical protein
MASARSVSWQADFPLHQARRRTPAGARRLHRMEQSAYPDLVDLALGEDFSDLGEAESTCKLGRPRDAARCPRRCWHHQRVLGHDRNEMRDFENRLQKKAVDVVGEPLPLDPSAELDQLEGHKSASVALAISQTPPKCSLGTTFSRAKMLVSSSSLLSSTTGMRIDKPPAVGPQHPARDLGRFL